MLTKEEIIAALASVAGPDGKTPLPESAALLLALRFIPAQPSAGGSSSIMEWAS